MIAILLAANEVERVIDAAFCLLTDPTFVVASVMPDTPLLAQTFR
jgi:hypothetical protein